MKSVSYWQSMQVSLKQCHTQQQCNLDCEVFATRNFLLSSGIQTKHWPPIDTLVSEHYYVKNIQKQQATGTTILDS